MKEDFCNTCNSPLKITLSNGIHYGRLDCPNCGFKGWARNPKSIKKGTTAEKRIGNKISVQECCNFHQIKEECCFICLRKRNELGYTETLTVDHIIELNKGGEDKVWNTQVLCSACHKLKNWARLYMNWHFKEGDNNGDTTTA
jgi:hypothetical protein